MSESRPGLYVLAFLTLLNSCDAATEAKKAANALKSIADQVSPATANAAPPQP